MINFNLSITNKFEKNKFKKHLVWNYLSLILLAISGIGVNIIISINYSAETLGVFNQVISTYIVFGMIGSGGINYSVLKGIQSNFKNQNEIRSLISGSILPTFIISSITTLIYFFLVDPVKNLVHSNNVGIGMIYITPGIFFFSINKVFIYGVINGFNRMRMFSIFLSLRYILILCILTIFIIIGVEGEKITAIFSITEFILFIFLISKISIYESWLGKNIFNSWVLKHIQYGTKNLFGGMFVELNSRVDIIMLGLFVDDGKVGIYSFAALFAEGFYQILIVLQNILNPIIARQLSEFRYSHFLKRFNTVKIYTYKYVAILFLFSVIIYPKMIEIFIKNSEFVESFIPFIILVSGITIASGYIPFYNIFSMANKPGLQSIFIIMIFSTNIIANAIFIPLMGYSGAALGTALSFLISIIYFKYLVYNYLEIKLR